MVQNFKHLVKLNNLNLIINYKYLKFNKEEEGKKIGIVRKLIFNNIMEIIFHKINQE